VLSVRRQPTLPRLAVGVCAGALLLGTAAGCQTTQEKAAKHQAEAERILDARAERQAQRKAKAKNKQADKQQKNGGTKQ
jgi:hypothetical protein